MRWKDRILYEEIKGTEYKQVITVNPTFSACTLRLSECISTFAPAGIRLVPGYHGYNIVSNVTDGVIEIARKHALPVFVSASLTDERLTHILYPEDLKMEDVLALAEKNRDVRIIINYIKDDKARQLATSGNVFCDTTGLSSGFLTCGSQEILKNAVFGSGFPLRTLGSSLLLMDEVSDEDLRLRVLEGKHIGL